VEHSHGESREERGDLMRWRGFSMAEMSSIEALDRQLFSLVLFYD